MIKHFSLIKKSNNVHFSNIVLFFPYILKLLFFAFGAILFNVLEQDTSLAISWLLISILIFIFLDSLILANYSLWFKKLFSIKNEFIFSLKLFPRLLIIKILRGIFFWLPLIVFLTMLYVVLNSVIEYLVLDNILIWTLILFLAIIIPVIIIALSYVLVSYVYFTLLEINLSKNTSLEFKEAFKKVFQNIKNVFKSSIIFMLGLLLCSLTNVSFANSGFIHYFMIGLNMLIGIYIFSILKFYFFELEKKL